MAGLNLDIGLMLNIDKQSADFALKAVNIYCNKNGLRIKENPLHDSIECEMEFVPNNEECSDCAEFKDYNYCPICGRRFLW